MGYKIKLKFMNLGKGRVGRKGFYSGEKREKSLEDGDVRLKYIFIWDCMWVENVR